MAPVSRETLLSPASSHFQGALRHEEPRLQLVQSA